jgi:hypothetical protein
MYQKIKMLRVVIMTSIMLLTCTLSAQPTLVKKWDKSFGGIYGEKFEKLILMYDGGYLLAGESSSIASGNKSQSVYDTISYQPDIWLVRLDSNGNKLWDRQLGNSKKNMFGDVIQTKDNSILVGGTVSGNPSHDLSQPPFCGDTNDVDFWLVKLDASGLILWDRRYGGCSEDMISSIIELNNGTIAITGYTSSDTSNFISHTNRDTTLITTDYWMLLIDNQGNYIKDFRFGGEHYDYVRTFINTSDGGYLIGGESQSCASGDKTSACKQLGSPIPDVWLIKTDSNGQILWDKTYGGSNNDKIRSIHEVELGYLLLMSTNSSQGDVSNPPISTNSAIFDIWLVEIDFSGNILNQSRRGGTGGENPRTLVVDSTITIMAITNSNISGDKSEENMAINEMWLLKLDGTGNKLWDKTILTDGGYSIDGGGMVTPSSNCYTLATNTTSGIAGDKTTLNFDSTETYKDMWVIKYCFEEVSSVDDLNEQSLRLFPNPTNSTLTIQTDAAWQEATATLTNLDGRVVLSQVLTNSQQQNLDIGHLPNGMYFVTIKHDGLHYSEKIIINR